MDRAERILTAGRGWYPLFDSGYRGGGFAFGAGYRRFVSPVILGGTMYILFELTVVAIRRGGH